MRGIFGLVLLIGMGLAGFAVYMVDQQLNTQATALERERERARQVVRTVEIYVPVRDITYGDFLLPEDVQLVTYVQENLPEGVFTTEEELFPQGLDTPRVVRIPMQINEPILAAKVTEPGAPRGLTALLDPGMRAFPLPSNLTRAFAGDLQVSDRIDLYWVGQIGLGASISRLVKSGLEIIAIEDAERGGRGVVVQVSQADFADIQVLSAAGNLSLTPVARDDADGGDTSIETNIRDVLGIVEEVVEEAPEEVAPERCFVTQRNGTERIEVEVDCAD
ncbi:Flp pilus assembly protein CpaB [Yoonia sp. F2084L]|uniref:Flp pilus assembly protein CpaB n=1 Tax=Yoonia sp. F2084L TaxID=2926419 RepID=UPI001FF1D6D6|nr:Flp pilus assembly protein CpaB [Yoonia sp. F2084L]MCK0095345.1 Flp pilus assembly protein CpaB [Yoonia sp. F2084L]